MEDGRWNLEIIRCKIVIMKKGTALNIVWEDAKGVTDRWEYADELSPQKTVKVMSIGFLLKKTKKYIQLVPNIGGGQVIGRITIPRRGIIKIQKVELLNS